MSSFVTDAYARYAYDIVKRICTEVGPGLSGTPQERARAKILQEEMESHLGADNVTMEEFTAAPNGLLGWFPAAAVFIALSALLNVSIGRLGPVSPWITAVLSVALAAVTALVSVFQFALYYRFLEPVLAKKQSVNVIGTLRKPGAKNVKRLLIIGGHHDSAMEMTWLRFLGYGYYVVVATIVIGLAAMLIFSGIQLGGLIASSPRIVRAGTLGYATLAYPLIPWIIFTAFFNRGGKGGGTVPGAADNLSGSALAVSMCSFLADNPSCIPDDTEIRFISFGSEEAGLRGSMSYVERHLDELKRLDARLLNIETVAYPEIIILTSDINGTVRNSPDMVREVAAAAGRAGVPHKVKPFPFGGGGTDAGSFSRAGLMAATIVPFKVPQQMVAFYHQKWDVPEVLTMEPLLNVLKLAEEWIRAEQK